GQARRPARVVQIILVEVDGTVFLRALAPIEMRSAPSNAPNGTLGRIEQAAMQAMRPDVLHSPGFHADGEVPARVDLAGRRARGLSSAMRDSGEVRAAMQDQRPFDTAVEMVADPSVGKGTAGQHERAPWIDYGRKRPARDPHLFQHAAPGRQYAEP